MKDEFDYKFDILLKEIDILQNGIKSYDSMIFTIKGWSITVFSAFIFFIVKEKQPIYICFSASVVILFWILEAIFKSFQRRYIIRYNRIEHFLRTKEFSSAINNRSFKGFNIPDVGARVSVKGGEKKISVFKAALYIHTSLLYISKLALLFATGILFYLKVII